VSIRIQFDKEVNNIRLILSKVSTSNTDCKLAPIVVENPQRNKVKRGFGTESGTEVYTST